MSSVNQFSAEDDCGKVGDGEETCMRVSARLLSTIGTPEQNQLTRDVIGFRNCQFPVEGPVGLGVQNVQTSQFFLKLHKLFMHLQ
jgi:hypothetical protein